MPFYEPGLPSCSAKQPSTPDGCGSPPRSTEVAAFGDVHFVCVGTPQKQTASTPPTCATSQAAFDRLAPLLRAGRWWSASRPCRSGTAADLAERIASSRPAARELAWNPEFLREGFAVEDTLRPDRIVLGVHTETAPRQAPARGLRAAPRRPASPLIVTDFATAELVKVAANSFLATKISFINAMAEVCEATGADVSSWPRRSATTRASARRFLHAGPRLRRRLPAQGHPRLHGPRRRARRRTRR